MKMWKQWMALLMIFCLLMPGALAGSIDLTDDLDEEVGSVTESSAGKDYTISDNGDIILDDDDDLGGDVIFDDDGSTIEITDNEIDDTIDPDKLDINTNLPSNVVNILLVGVDTRSTSLDDGLQNGDVQIIVSINKDDGSIKLTSILRDLYVTIPGYKNKNRINAAYSRGGGQLAMRTINKNFELNIENYITINFYGLASIIDSLGGIDIEMTAKEAKAINTYLRQHPPKYDNQSKDYTRENLPNKAGTHHCDGIQAVMYLIFWVYFFATGSGVTFTLWVLAVPFVVLEVMLLGLGVGIIVSSLTTKYRDLAIAVGFGVQLWMYASPVVYPLSMLDNSPRLRVLVQLNPMTSPIEIFRMATLGTGTVTTFGIVYSLIFTAAALVLGVVLFSRIEKTFMDTV